MRYLTTLLLNALCLLAQPGPTPTTPVGFQIKQFLQLSDAQFVTIFNNNEQFARLAGETNRRVNQLRGEIAVETDRPKPDPLELGNRYAEIALVCRFLETEGKRVVERNVAVLTDAQRTRLRSLDEAIKLLPVIAEAQAVRLMEGVIPSGFGGLPLGLGVGASGGGSLIGGGGLTGFLLGPEIALLGACPSTGPFVPVIGSRVGGTDLNPTDNNSR
jgi:hypothetical protein